MEDSIFNILDQKLDLIALMSDYLKLERKGQSYVALCPFHDDKNPSLLISPTKQIFKCFSCGEGGNKLNFIKKYKKISWSEAIPILAKKAGIELPNNWSKYASHQKINKQHQRLYDLNEIALYKFMNNLQLKKNETVQNHLKQRGLTPKSIVDFKIGYCDATVLQQLQDKTMLKKQNQTCQNLIASGLFYRDDEQQLKSNFLNRIIFPIIDQNNNVVGFGGRTIAYAHNQKIPKYINTIQTKIFFKGNVLYNINQVIAHRGLMKHLIIVEGYMDVIALHQGGFKNVIALLGTTLSQQQMQKIKALSKNIILFLDSDRPGLTATYNNILKLWSCNNFTIKVVFAREYLNFSDPDHWFQHDPHLSKKLKTFLLSPEAWLEKGYASVFFDSKNEQHLNAFIRKLIKMLVFFPKNDQKYKIKADFIKNKLHKKYNLAHSTIASLIKATQFEKNHDNSHYHLQRLKQQTRAIKAQVTSHQKKDLIAIANHDKTIKAENYILCLIVHSRSAYQYFAKKELWFNHHDQARIFAKLNNYYQSYPAKISISPIELKEMFINDASATYQLLTWPYFTQLLSLWKTKNNNHALQDFPGEKKIIDECTLIMEMQRLKNEILNYEQKEKKATDNNDHQYWLLMIRKHKQEMDRFVASLSQMRSI